MLIGRRGVTPEVAPAARRATRAGATVVAEAVDVSDAAALGALLARIRADGPPLRGVVHSAGVLDDAALLQQDAERFARVFAPKVQGGHLLDALTRSDPLDFFVLFSSVAAVLGSPGQANHSAANAFLDVLARERAQPRLAGTVASTGARGRDVGAAADRGVTERLAAQGLGAVTPSQGLLALERLLAQGAAQAAVLPIDWQRYFDQARHGATPAFLSDVAARPRPPRRGCARPAARRWTCARSSPPPRRGAGARWSRPSCANGRCARWARPVARRRPAHAARRAGARLAAGGRAAQHAGHGPRPAAAGHLAVRLPDDRRADRLPPRRGVWRSTAPAAAAPAARRSAVAASLVGSIEELSDEEVERHARRARETGRLT